MAEHRTAFIGFGEAGQALAEGLGAGRAPFSAFDLKTDHDATRMAMRAAYARYGVAGAESLGLALAGADVVLCLVTADQSVAAARAAAPHLAAGALFCDGNSTSPGAKLEAAQVIEAAGARYVDLALMAPVRPLLARVPMLAAGPHAAIAAEALGALGLQVRALDGAVGAAAAIKLARSVMVKGLEALTAECLLAAQASGVLDEVVASLDASWPGWDWRAKGDYNLERMMVHGRRRAAEMRAAADMVAELGLGGAMARATADWQDRIGELDLDPPSDLSGKFDALLKAQGISRA